MILPLFDLPRPRCHTNSTRNYLSYSALNTFQICPLRYFFRYVMGLPEESVAASLVFGSAIHACLQFHFEELMAGQPCPRLAWLLDVYQDFWQAHTERQIRYGSGEDHNSLGHLAERMLRAFQSSDFARPEGNILGVEEELRGSLGSGLPDLLARVDLLIEWPDRLDLIDIKTSRQRWNAAQLEEKANQLLLYHQLARHLADGRLIRLSFAVLTKTKLPQVNLVPVATDPHKINRFQQVVQRVWRAIQAESYYPNPSAVHCPTCPFQKPCQAWSG